MMRTLILTLAAAVYAVSTVAQTNIPDPLLKNSDAVVRLNSVEFVYLSPISARIKTIEEITILNIAAADKANYLCYISPERSLKKFEGTIRDAKGNILRKIKRSDLKYTEFSNGLADDNAYYYFEALAPTCPYTVRFETEMTLKNGILEFTPFIPIPFRETSLEKGVYTLSVPQGMQFGYKSILAGEPIKQTADGCDIYTWKLENIPAVKAEPHSPPLIEQVPLVYIVPYDFRYQNTEGSLRDWASVGAWLSELQAGRDLIPQALKQEVHRRTDTLSTAHEKIRALYDYLGKSTRYVSIQLGIGSLRPMAAEEVYKTKFGDCKALTNYLRTMLRECGIDSDYAIIHTDQERMFRDFASLNQVNHLILHVPLDDQTLWLECTNTDYPLGYIHDKIAGHDAMMIRDGKGEIVTLPRYADTLNRMVRDVEVTLAEDGSAQGRISERYEVWQYERMMFFAKKESRKQNDILLSNLKIPMVKVENIDITEDKNALPSIQIDYTISSPRYCNISGNRCFLPQTPYSNAPISKEKERLYDIHYTQGYLDITNVTYHIPDNMELESIPRKVSITMPFGSYEQQCTFEKGKVTVVQRTCYRAGNYSREMFKEYQNFRNARAMAFNSTFVLKK